MKRVHLLGVDGDPEEFASLLAMADGAGLRIGWLEYSEIGLPEPLASAAESGLFRTVAVGQSSTVSVKLRSGPAVQTDLIREYFRGCALVLISGVDFDPRVRSFDGGWQIRSQNQKTMIFSTSELVESLSRVEPFCGQKEHDGGPSGS